MKPAPITFSRIHQGQYSGLWMVTDPERRSYVCVVDGFGELVEVLP